MINKIKNKIEKNLLTFLNALNKDYFLKATSPLLFEAISDFVLRKGKRARPILFIIGYLGFSKKEPEGLYTSALSLELLHDFMLVHDDIIDKSLLRRGKPSAHTMLNQYLKEYKNVKFNGEDLAIVIGDVMYAMGLHAFLSVNENLCNKEKALRKLIDAAVYTGCGEFIELLSGLKNISEIKKADIYKIYDFKTAYYTFATPLSMGALLAGAKDKQADILFHYGIYVGRAFQIKDDILGIFGKERTIGKSVITDLQEAKKTILIWYAYHHTQKTHKLSIQKALGKNNLQRSDLLEARSIIKSSGALEYAKQEISHLIKKAKSLLSSSTMNKECKKVLSTYADEILNVA